MPLINQALVPDAVAPGGAGSTLSVNGTGFVAGSVADWNGSARATTYVNQTELTATILAGDIAAAGTASATVVNAPGGVRSNLAFFSVAAATTTVTFGNVSAPAAGGDPDSVAVGDFNGDGKQDLAVTDKVSDTVSVVPGDGDMRMSGEGAA